MSSYSDFDIALDHIQIAAPPGCEQAARHFYGQLLGMREVPKPEPLRERGGCWFVCGAHQVHIGVQSDFRPATKAHPAFAIRDLAHLRQKLLDFGVVVSSEEVLEGRRRFYADDPWGNRLEFIERAE